MHCLLKMDIKKQCDKKVDPEIIKIIKKKIENYNTMVQINKDFQGGVIPYPPEKLNEYFEEIVLNLPLGFNLTARITSNYLQLLTILFQRDGHKMGYWEKYIDWILTLPLMQAIVDNFKQKK